MDKTLFNKSDLDKFLSNKEIEEIDYLNNKSNHLQKTQYSRRNPMNMTISEIVNKWATINIHTIIDLTNFFSGLNKYKMYFDDIDETGQWFTGINKILKEFMNIFIKNGRSLYIGLTLILISFSLYLIQITS